MKKFFSFIFLFLVNIISSQSNLYDTGYKDFKWGLSSSKIQSLLDNNFYLDKYSPNSYLVTATDRKTNLVYLKREDEVEYKYDFWFFNDSLYEITLEIFTSEKRNYPLIRELKNSFSHDSEKSYGKPKEIKFSGSYWYETKVDIYE